MSCSCSGTGESWSSTRSSNFPRDHTCLSGRTRAHTCVHLTTVESAAKPCLVPEVAVVTGIFDALTPMELGQLKDRLSSAERRSLSTARTAADPEVWPLVRLSADMRDLVDDVTAATCRHMDARARG